MAIGQIAYIIFGESEMCGAMHRTFLPTNAPLRSAQVKWQFQCYFFFLLHLSFSLSFPSRLECVALYAWPEMVFGQLFEYPLSWCMVWRVQHRKVDWFECCWLDMMGMSRAQCVLLKCIFIISTRGPLPLAQMLIQIEHLLHLANMDVVLWTHVTTTHTHKHMTISMDGHQCNRIDS